MIEEEEKEIDIEEGKIEEITIMMGEVKNF